MGINPFQTGTSIPNVRHSALKLDGKTLFIFYSRIGDNPERILLTRLDLEPDWTKWKITKEQTILQPEMEYEGSDLPLVPSKIGDAVERVNELRDPCIYEEGERVFLLYSVAGESGIGIAELLEKGSTDIPMTTK
jgi:hypothetical protein